MPKQQLHKSGVTPQLRQLIDEWGGQSAFAKRVWGNPTPHKGKVRKWYYGHTGIRLDEAGLVADKCGRTVDWLLTGKEGSESGSWEPIQDARFRAFAEGFPAATGMNMHGLASRVWYHASGNWASGERRSYGREITGADEIAAARAVGKAMRDALASIRVKVEDISPWQAAHYAALMLSAFETVLIGPPEFARRSRMSIPPKRRKKGD